MIKYGTYIIYECKHCHWQVTIPLHQKNNPQLEKYASYCTHDWEIIGEIDEQQIDEEKS